MDLRKLVSLERLVSVLCSKGRVISGFGLGVLASLVVVSLLFSVGGNSGLATVDFVPSVLSRFFPLPGNSSLMAATGLSGSWMGKRWGDVGGLDSKDGPVSEGQGGVWGFTGGENLTGGDVVGSREVGVQGGSDGNDTSSGAYLGGSSVGKSPENDTVGSGVVKQGEASECSPKGNFTGVENGSGFLRSESSEKPNGKSSSADLMETSSMGGGELPPGDAGTANLSLQDGYHSLFVASRVEDKTNKTGSLDGGVGTVEQKTNQTVLLDQGGNESVGGGEAKEQNEAADTHKGSSSSGRINSGLPGKCDIFDGRWVRDETKPLYLPGSCPHIDMDFNCHDNGRQDSEFLRWRWQPNDCEIPSLNATDFLMRLRGQRLIFVGDSLNRNMWESLICILRHSVGNKSGVYEMSGRNQFKTSGYYSFIFKDYNCSVDFVRSPFLVRELYTGGVNGSEDEKLRLDAMDATTSAYSEADIIVFNTGHWWTHEKTSKGINYYQEGGHVYPALKVMEAYKKALSTWAKWVDKNINPKKTQVFFRGFSLTHFSGGQWNSGGQCHKETEPIFNQSFIREYPEKMLTLEEVLKQMKTPVIYLNISRLTDYRKDGHPSIYRKNYSSVEEQINAEKVQDCSHWCLPGVPDTWNELLYASLLMVGRGSWGN